MYAIPGYEHDLARRRAAKAEPGKRSAGLDYEDVISANGHEDAELRLDQALEDTFPASDALSITQPGSGRQVKFDSNSDYEVLTANAREWEDVASEVLSHLALADIFPMKEQRAIRQPRLRRLVQISMV